MQALAMAFSYSHIHRRSSQILFNISTINLIFSPLNNYPPNYFKNIALFFFPITIHVGLSSHGQLAEYGDADEVIVNLRI